MVSETRTPATDIPEPADAEPSQPCCQFRRLYIAEEEYRSTAVEGQPYRVKYAKIAFEMEPGADPRRCVLVNWCKGCKYTLNDAGQLEFDMAVHHLGGFHDWRFPDWSIDSIDPDPVFWSDRGSTRWNYNRQGANTYWADDRPGACAHPQVHAVEFKTSLYCIDDVPTTTNTTGSNIGTPLDSVEWVDSIRWRDRNTPEHPALPDTQCGA